MRILLFPWLFLIPFFTILIGNNVVSVSGQCLKDQSSLLLRLKKSLEFDPKVSTKLVNWTQTSDCCDWEGVTCNNHGQVTGLNLSNRLITGGIHPSSGLFSLQFLSSLNLADNNFNFTQIPSTFGNLTRLAYLNLSNARFSGQIPIEFSRLTTLVSLDLSSSPSLPGNLLLRLENPSLFLLVRNLTGLQELLLDGVNISATAREWGKAVSSSLPKLRIFSLSNCFVSGPIDSSLQKLRLLSEIRLSQNNLSAIVPEFFANFPNLAALRLTSCNLYGTFPEQIFQIPTLETLDLYNNKLLHGLLPEFPKNGSLRTLVLRNTSFSGALPDSLSNLKLLSTLEIPNCNFSGVVPNFTENLTQLVHLDLSSNNFTGPIPSFNMSKDLKYIDLSHNALTGGIPSAHFEGLSSLVYVNFAYNSLNGSIPSSLFSIPSLQKILLSNNQFGGEVAGFSNESLHQLDTLDLSSNKLQGPIPTSFFELGRLNVLLLSFNNFSGTIELGKIQRLRDLTRLELSYNRLSINGSDSHSSFSSFPQLSILKMASCKLNFFPQLKNQSRMVQLDLSNNQISGEIPNWIWKIGNGSLMQLMNLSFNVLEGLQEPYSFPSLGVLDLHSNQLRGEIPLPPQSAAYVDYSSNNFNLSIPAQIGNNLTFAYFFSLSNNSLTGTIPESICNLTFLNVLDLSDNDFSGAIPPCLIGRSTKTLGVLNLRNNDLGGNIPGTFPESCALRTLDLSGNHLEGKVPKSLANCTELEVLNLGNNEINDGFPCFLKNSSGLRVLVLRSNRFQGVITNCGPASHGVIWPKLQIIDLASNNFTGYLPRKIVLHWQAMMVDVNNAQSDPNHLRFEFLNFGNFYYQDTVTVTNKGLQMELVKILTVFTSIDISDNSFQGVIPSQVGSLKSLYVLNLSHNALTGPIPPSIGNLTQLESLDLSQNKLNGSIPVQLASLTFLSVLNLSYNQLVGMIPKGSQFQTFSEASFEGNTGLCGIPLNSSCDTPSWVPPPAPSPNVSGSFLNNFHWQFVITGLGFGIGAGVIVGPLMFWKQGNNWCDEHIEKFVWMVLPTLGSILACCNDVKVESEDEIEESLNDKGNYDEDEEKYEMEGKAFSGQYCVFCSKLDIHRKQVIHSLNCSCHGLPSSSPS